MWTLPGVFTDEITHRSDDGDGNENVKKKSKTRTLYVQRGFFKINFFAVTARLRSFYGGCQQATTKFYSLFELGYCS